MKTLIVVRHAKSSWDASNVSDHERPLNKRGHRDAPDMANRVLAKMLAIDLFVSSTALRAHTTAMYFARAYQKGQKDILTNKLLYLAAPETIYEVVSALPDSCNAAALFGHNPGITHFANTLTRTQIDDMPTCAVYAVTAQTDSWTNFEAASKHFLFFDYPKSF